MIQRKVSKTMARHEAKPVKSIHDRLTTLNMMNTKSSSPSDSTNHESTVGAMMTPLTTYLCDEHHLRCSDRVKRSNVLNILNNKSLII